MNTFEKWLRVARTMPAELRAARYATWRAQRTIPQEWVQAIEKSFPAQDESHRGHREHRGEDLPSGRQLLANAGQATLRNAASVLRGEPLGVDEAEATRRRAICDANVCGMYRAESERCAHPKCGCYLRLKIWLKAECCPMALW